MRKLLLIGLALAGSLSGQWKLKVESASQLSVRVSDCGGSGSTAVWPAAKDLGNRFQLAASHTRFGIYTSRLETLLLPFGLRIAHTGNQTNPGKDLCASEGTNDLLLTITDSKPRTVRFTIDPSSSGSAVDRTLWVDIHADGSFEYKASVVRTRGTIPAWFTLVSIGPKPLKIKIRTATAWEYCGGQVATTFGFSRPIPCDVARFGQSCGKPRLEGPFPFDFDNLYLQQTAGHPNVLGALVVGVHQVSVPLPGPTACRLYTDPGLVHFYRTDAFGRANLFLPIPSTSPSFGNLQLLNAIDRNGTLDIEASRATTVVCR